MQTTSLHRESGFALLEGLVALVIVSTALGTCLRAVSSLANNNEKPAAPGVFFMLPALPVTV